jgi:membrane-anchored protein YejM (alkaline phosphatase superfamily)
MLIAYARGEIEGLPSEDHIRRMIDLYDGGIAYADAELERLFSALERAGISDSTTLVLTSDHGEAFFEHGLPLHEDLHHENLHVPLILKDPDLEPRRLRGVVQNMDIVPAILELVGVGGHQRSALQELLSGEISAEETSAYSVSTDEVALTTQEDKLIVPWDGGGVESADVSGAVRYQRGLDLNESAALPGGEAGTLLESLLEVTDQSVDIREAIAPTGGRSRYESSEAQRSELRALGYVD